MSSLNDVCSNKLFMSGMSGSVGLTVLLFTVLIWPAIIDTDNKVDAVVQQVAENNVYEIKQEIKVILQKIDSLEDSNARIETNIEHLLEKP